MSIRHYKGTAIDCDACEQATISDDVEVALATLQGFAEALGWKIDQSSGRDLCPDCAKNESGVNLALVIHGAPRHA